MNERNTIIIICTLVIKLRQFQLYPLHSTSDDDGWMWGRGALEDVFLYYVEPSRVIRNRKLDINSLPSVCASIRHTHQTVLCPNIHLQGSIWSLYSTLPGTCCRRMVPVHSLHCQEKALHSIDVSYRPHDGE